MRVYPRRWLILVVCAAALAAVGGLIEFRSGSGVAGAVIGAAVGAVLGLCLVLYFARFDTATIALRERFPDAIVRLVSRDDSLVRGMSRLAESQARLELRHYVPVVFDQDGIGFWSDGRMPERRAFVPWSNVESLALGPVVSPKVRSAPLLAPVELVARDRDGLMPSIRFGVLTERSSGALEKEDGVLALLEQIRSLRGQAPATRQPMSYSGGLVPGMTAHAAGRLGPISYPVLSAISFLAFVPFLVARLVDAPTPLIFALIVAALPFFTIPFLLTVRQERAAAREAKAGYTTKNGSSLHLEQRHPVTGVVIRRAHERALSKREFADLLR